MKVISKFKDYYDCVAFAYGGGDPKIWYNRNVIPHTEVELSHSPYLETDLSRKHWKSYSSSHLVVGQRCYTVLSELYNYNSGYFLPDANHEIMKHKVSWKGMTFARLYEELHEKMFYNENKSVISLCKLVGAPVFLIQHMYRQKEKLFIQISPDVPNLSKIKHFARYYPAEQIYQDLSYVLGNLMLEPPDNAPPVMVEEKVRFAKKGFDAKTSFRGSAKR